MKRRNNYIVPMCLVIIVTASTLLMLLGGEAKIFDKHPPKSGKRSELKNGQEQASQAGSDQGDRVSLQEGSTKHLSTQILVNRDNPLPKDYVPTDLKVLSGVRFVADILPEKKKMRREAAEALEELLAEADKENVNLYCVSGFRSFGTQKIVYNYQVKTYGKAKADQYVARPGQSEHQTGLAMDLTIKEWARNTAGRLNQGFAETGEGKWIMGNAHRFGFIVRYPSDKENITGFKYEPWHIRYVGVEAAEEIVSKGITLEEYLR